MLYGIKTTVYCICLGIVTGCSTTAPTERVDYKKMNTLPTLEVPPDLSSSSIEEQLVIPGSESNTPTTYSNYEGQVNNTAALQHANKNSVLPTVEQVQVKRYKDQRWLVVQGEVEDIWPKVHDFWLEQGFLLVVDDPRIGILETQWAENRADIPQDGIRKYLGRALDTVYSASTRDKYRVRLERGQAPGTTEIYLTHRGAEEVSQGENFVWQGRPSSPELEAEMLNRLLAHFGIEKQQGQQLLASAQQVNREQAELIRNPNGEIQLLVKDELESTWQRMGLAIDRIGFLVEDSDREKSIYFIRYLDPDKQEKGFWDKLFGAEEKDNQEYQIHLTAEGDSTTNITVFDSKGQADHGKIADRILTLLHEQLK